MGWKEFKLKVQGLSRGRNGFFDAARVDLVRVPPTPGTSGDDIVMEVYSRRVGRTAPIKLSICPQDAVDIGRHLVKLGMGLDEPGS